MGTEQSQKVDAASSGKVGYVYMPDMGGAGLNEFVKQWFPQIRKQGIISMCVTTAADSSINSFSTGCGGFWSEWDQRATGSRVRCLRVVFYGYMACLTNQYAASDGDFFSYFFKDYKLGPLIGERTWGGVRGIRGQIPLMDGGYITRPEFSRYDLNSKWVIENKGVVPDIVVDNRPDQVVKGQDPQLEKAIQDADGAIQANPKNLPPRPPDLPAYPDGPGL